MYLLLSVIFVVVVAAAVFGYILGFVVGERQAWNEVSRINEHWAQDRRMG